MKNLPIGIQTFEAIRKKSENYLYVDKTEDIYRLVTEGKRYFLARPRRFGKSLLCSTLCSLFQGRKDLFEGLWIAQSNWRWEERPVVSISMAKIMRTSPGDFRKYLCKKIIELGGDAEIVLPDDLTSPGYLLNLLVKQLFEKNKQPVVMLIDEYDKPILDNIENPPLVIAMREVLREFYEMIKDLDKYLYFVLFTGVSKFSKTSIFSGNNNLRDISQDAVAATLCGITQKELETDFAKHLDTLAQRRKLSQDEVLFRLKDWYNGYRFEDDGHRRVYNPFSLLNVFQSLQFRNYWFASGTPTFLMKLMQQNNYPVIDLSQKQVRESELEVVDVGSINLASLMLQTGYLTIDEYYPDRRRYRLCFPNEEVFRSLTERLTDAMLPMQGTCFDDYVEWFRQSLQAGDIDHFCKTLQQFFSEIPYTIQMGEEKYYQTIFFIVCRLLTRKVVAEVATNIGRIDAVFESEERVVIIEFKVNKSSAMALHQVEDRNYASAYQGSGKKIFLVGINFDVGIRNIATDWVIKELVTT